MEQRRGQYEVGGHLFEIQIPAEMAHCMGHYEAFQAEEGQPLFRIDVERADYKPGMEYKYVYTDQSDEDMPRIELYHSEKGWLMGISMQRESAICCYMEIDSRYEQTRLYIGPDCADDRFAIDNAAMMSYAIATAKRKTLVMHASVTVRAGKGYLFLGHSGTGKSTHSGLWQAAYADAWLLNDDNPILRLMDNGETWVFGSPWSGKTPCYKQAWVQVGGIVQLKQAPENRIRRLGLPEAYGRMLASCSGLKVEPKNMDAIYETIYGIIRGVKLYELECRPDTAAAQLCHDTIAK